MTPTLGGPAPAVKPSNLELALDMARRGYSVAPAFPKCWLCPQLVDVSTATRDPRRIRAIWRRWPDARVVVVLGEAVA